MKRFILTAVLLFGTAPTSYAFLDSFYKQSEVVQQARPDLLDVIDQQQDTKLNIQLHIGNDNTGYLAAKDMVVELHPNRVAPDYDRVVKLPGADGYFAHCSSGHRSLDLLNKANYINLDGTQHIDLQMGCWEVCWVKDKPAGTLVCAFRVTEDYTRNDAVLPCGDMWLSFPVWTLEGLIHGQSEKRRIMELIKMNLLKRDEELEKFDNTNNPIKKALYLRNAFNFAERCGQLHHHTLDTIPDENQILSLQDNLILATNGLIWRKNGDGHVLLGSALVTNNSKTTTTGVKVMP